jgi:hypothetical protein
VAFTTRSGAAQRAALEAIITLLPRGSRVTVGSGTGESWRPARGSPLGGACLPEAVVPAISNCELLALLPDARQDRDQRPGLHDALGSRGRTSSLHRHRSYNVDA